MEHAPWHHESPGAWPEVGVSAPPVSRRREPGQARQRPAADPAAQLRRSLAGAAMAAALALQPGPALAAAPPVLEGQGPRPMQQTEIMAQ